jgi:capsular polysaccharide biosynthesis protein
VKTLLLVVIVIAAVAGVSVAVGESFGRNVTADGIVFVRPGTPSPGNQDQATKLAVSLSEIIPKDSAILAAVGRRLNITSADAAGRVSVTVVQNTSVLELNFRDTDPTRALEGALALTQAVAGSHPAALGVSPGALSIVRLPKRPVAANPLKLSLPIGVVLGALLAYVLALALGRRSPAISNERDLREFARSPSSRLDWPPDASVLSALHRRWAELAGGDHPAVVIVPASPAGAAAASELARRITDLSRTELARSPRRRTRLLGDAEAIEPLALHAVVADEDALRKGTLPVGIDAAVILVVAGTRASAVRSTIEALSDFGRDVRWSLFVDNVPRG